MYLKNESSTRPELKASHELSDSDVNSDAHIEFFAFLSAIREVYKLHHDFLKYMRDMEGVLIQQTLEVCTPSSPTRRFPFPLLVPCVVLRFTPLWRHVEPGRSAALLRGRLPVRRHAVPARPAHRRRSRERMLISYLRYKAIPSSFLFLLLHSHFRCRVLAIVPLPVTLTSVRVHVTASPACRATPTCR